MRSKRTRDPVPPHGVDPRTCSLASRQPSARSHYQYPLRAQMQKTQDLHSVFNSLLQIYTIGSPEMVTIFADRYPQVERPSSGHSRHTPASRELQQVAMPSTLRAQTPRRTTRLVPLKAIHKGPCLHSGLLSDKQDRP